MMKLIEEYSELLSDKQLGRLLKMTINEKETSSDRTVNYLYKKRFKPKYEKSIETAKKRSIAGKKGGRPKKKGSVTSE